jgi:nitroimidazol reductase NimA-like FMN-containing flavoprotein (pyridoxamine 5'-phosphate oxidase superfamily)
MDNPEPPRPMRRAESEITARAQLEEVLRKAKVLFLSLRDAQAPYVVPVCFGWEGDTLYVHSALSGTKIDLIRADPAVGFSACTDIILKRGATACDFSLQAQSVAGTGRARILADDKERARGLDLIMRHYSEGDSAEAPVYGVPAERVRPSGRARTRALAYGAGSLSRTCVIAITIESLRGRQLGRRTRRTGTSV